MAWAWEKDSILALQPVPYLGAENLSNPIPPIPCRRLALVGLLSQRSLPRIAPILFGFHSGSHAQAMHCLLDLLAAFISQKS